MGFSTRLIRFIAIAPIVILLHSTTVDGQIYVHDRNPPYLKVFKATDDFDTSYLAQIEKAVEVETRDSIRFSMIHDLGYYWHTRNLLEARKITEFGLQEANKEKDELWEGRFQIVLASILLRADKLDSAEVLLNRAEGVVTKGDLPFLHTQMGYVKERRGLIDEAADEVLIALKIGKELNDPHAIAMAYSDLSYLFWKQSKLDKALEYGLKSESIFEKKGIDNLDYNFTLYIIGVYYLSRKNYDKSLEYFSKAIQMAERYGFYNNLSDIYISLIDLHTDIEEYDKAEENSKKAIEYAQLLNNDFLLMRSWLSVGKLQNLQDQPGAAISSLSKSLDIATEAFGDEFYLQQVYQELSKAYAATGNFNAAYQSMLKFDALKETIFTAEADQRISQLQTEFDVEQKIATIASQEKMINQRRRLQLLTVAFIVLLTIILISLYWSFRKNKKMNATLADLNQNLEIKNIELDDRNQENELLLKEIHHRVKNNLEVISSLLELQSGQIKDKNVQDIMLASQNRVQSMSIIHQKLYQGKNLASIEMKDYFKNLCESILESFDAEKRIKIKYRMKEMVLDVDTAVPIGLIVNELLTNSLKYAFPEGKRGSIEISLEKHRENLELYLSDDGIGRKENNVTNGTGFGGQLVSLLTRQLNGTMSEDGTDGTTTSFTFLLKRAS